MSKLPPYLPDTINENTPDSLTDTDMRNLHEEWGFNAVRLGVMWVAVEPYNGTVNQTYLAEVRKLSDRLHEHGLYTLVDGHQDLLGPDLCGEGFPLWAVRRAFDLQHFDRNGLGKFPMPWLWPLSRDNITDFPSEHECVQHLFIDFYSTFGASTAFGSLYQEKEMRTYYASYWKHVATIFRHAPGVLAYEILNEPGPGNIYDPLYWPSDRQSLLPLYNLTHQAIRSVDDDTTLFFEGVPTDQYIGEYLKGSTDLMAPSGPGGAKYANREALAYHVYCPPGSNEFVCDGMIDLAWTWLQRSKLSMTEGTIGSIMTEFGAVDDDPSSVRLLEKITRAADARLQSWFYWTYRSYGDITTQNSNTETFFHQNGSIQYEKIKTLSTTYPQSVAGVPSSISYAFNQTDARFVLEYITMDGTCNVSDSTTTDIFLNEKMWYPSGFVCKVFSVLGNAVACKVKQKNYLEVQHPCGYEGSGTKVMVSIVRK